MQFSIFPKEDKTLTIRLQRQLVGAVSYLMFLLPLAYSVHQGWLRFGYSGLGLFLGLALAINACFFVAIRSGVTRRFADPSLMQLQIGIAGLLALVIGYYVEDKAMVVVLMLIFTAFFFGIFSFGMREYLALTGSVAVGYAVMLLLKYDAPQRAGESLRLEFLNFMILMIVLLWMSLLGSYIAGLRTSLARKKKALDIALARLKELSSRDELTGLHNRRHLMEVLESQHDRAARHNEPFALCILDIDFFKHINDTHGHGVGDEALKLFSERIHSQLRKMDVVARAEVDSLFGRYGGEEFLLLLPYAEGSGARCCVERLRSAMHAEPFVTSIGPIPITFSAGVALYRQGESTGALINRADEALYVAKTSGRDRIECVA